jgi:hypothetical protein
MLETADDVSRSAARTDPAPSRDADLLAMALQTDNHLVARPGKAPEVPGYDIISRLGTGASGEVWLAEESDTGRTAALKILHHYGAAGASVEFLQREIQVLAKLVHPHLVLLHRAVTACDGRQGLATEWIDGWPLDQWLERHPELSLSQKLDLFRGIVSGVAFLHDHGVIHRDLKPANLIVDTQGKAKIVDFGLARLHQEGTAAGIDGGSIGVSGTLHFMAPEQAANAPGSRAMPVDVYALGLILYRLLTGRWLRPVEGTPSETLAVVLNPPPLVLQAAAKTLPRDLQSILRQALAPDPTRRYRHARDLEADLDRFAAKKPVAARKHTLVYLTTTLLRRQARRSIIAACLVLAGLSAGGMIYHRHRQVAVRNEANLRYAYTLTAFTLGRLRDELRGVAPQANIDRSAAGGDLPGTEATARPRLPLDAKGQLDLRYYQAQLEDIRSATSESHSQNQAALAAIQTALDLYSQLAKEAPEDPQRLLDAAQARLSFARLLDRTGHTAAGGEEVRKTLRQLDRLAAWPGFVSPDLATIRCDALRLAAKHAHRTNQHDHAVDLAYEMLAIAESLPSGLLVSQDLEFAPRLALAASELATYACHADESRFSDAKREIQHATARCRDAYIRDPDAPALARGLACCLLANARVGLHEGAGGDLHPLFEEAAELLTGESSRIRLSSFPLTKEISACATGWLESVLDHPETKVPLAAHVQANRFITHLRTNGAASEDIMIQRARLYLCESVIDRRLNQLQNAARASTNAVRLLSSRHKRDPGNLPLTLLAATALHQARTLRGHSYSIWRDEVHGPYLDRLIQQLSERSGELSPEQIRRLETLRRNPP